MAYTDAQRAQAELDRELAQMILRLIKGETNHMSEEGQFASGMTALIACAAGLIASGKPSDLKIEIGVATFSQQLRRLIKDIQNG